MEKAGQTRKNIKLNTTKSGRSNISGCSSHVQDHLFKYHCNFCNVDNSYGYGGVNDLKAHEGIGNQCNVLLLQKSY